MTRLAADDIAPAVIGGTILSAGGSGRERMAKDTRFGELAIGGGAVRLVDATAIAADAPVLIASAVGAPGGATKIVNPEHSIEAARQLIATTGCRPAAVIPGHVPGMYAWLVASALEIPLLDAACNGRGHPTVKMGSLGLSSQPTVRLHQSGVGDNVRLLVHGNTSITSQLMRAAAVQNGGLIMACRGPVAREMVSAAGAPGAISYQLALGRAVLGAGTSGTARIAAALRQTGGRVLAEGSVVHNTVQYGDGFDVGEVVVTASDGSGSVRLGVCNEFMTAHSSAGRIATFPDLIAAMDPRSGDVLAISELVAGMPVLVFAVSKRQLPMGSGIFDPSVYPDVERAMNTELARYALDPNA